MISREILLKVKHAHKADKNSIGHCNVVLYNHTGVVDHVHERGHELTMTVVAFDHIDKVTKQVRKKLTIHAHKTNKLTNKTIEIIEK